MKMLSLNITLMRKNSLLLWLLSQSNRRNRIQATQILLRLTLRKFIYLMFKITPNQIYFMNFHFVYFINMYKLVLKNYTPYKLFTKLFNVNNLNVLTSHIELQHLIHLNVGKVVAQNKYFFYQIQ